MKRGHRNAQVQITDSLNSGQYAGATEQATSAAPSPHRILRQPEKIVHVVQRIEPIVIRNESYNDSADRLTRPVEEVARGSIGTVEAHCSLGRASSEERAPGLQPGFVDAGGAVRLGIGTRSRAPAAISPSIFSGL